MKKSLPSTFLVISAAILAAGCGPTPAFDHQGEESAQERVKHRLEAVGHAVEGGVESVKSGLVELGQSVEAAGQALKLPQASAPEPTASGPMVFDAPSGSS